MTDEPVPELTVQAIHLEPHTQTGQNPMPLIILFALLALPSQDMEEPSLADVVTQAFSATHDGWSSDEVILHDDLNTAFVQYCQKLAPTASSEDCNWTLMNLRKAGKLSAIKTTRRAPRADSDYSHIAEIAARSMMDQHRTTIDQIMADPEKRKQFDELAVKYDSEVDPYSVRKAAFSLRKARRLRPELITRIADWGRTISELKIEKAQAKPELIPEQPGIYIFRDATGYLYIGQSDDLRKRLEEHFDESSNRALASYLDEQSEAEIRIELHAFPVDSRAKEVMVRRAYESELIRSRKPRFNILP